MKETMANLFESETEEWSFIESARASIKHPHFQYAVIDADSLTVEYKIKKWYRWFSGKRIVQVKIQSMELYEPKTSYQWNIKRKE